MTTEETTRHIGDLSVELPIISSSAPLRVTSKTGKRVLSGLALLLLAAGTLAATNISGYIANKYDMPENVGQLMAEETCKEVTREFETARWYNRVFQYGSNAGCEAFLESNRRVAYK